MKEASQNEWMDGSTAIILALSSSEVIVANLGDSRAVLGVVVQGNLGATVVDPVALSRDHKPDDPDELQRIEDAGGLVLERYGSGVPRVMVSPPPPPAKTPIPTP